MGRAFKKKLLIIIVITFTYSINITESGLKALEEGGFYPSYNIEQEISSFQDVGLPQAVCSCWKETEINSHLTNESNIEIADEEGLLYKYSTNITDIEALPINSSVEDFNPALAPDEMFVSSDEYVYMGFQINGSELVKINGFWIYVRGESRGDITYQVFNSIPGNASTTYPNVTSPVSTQFNVTITPIIQTGEEQWLWLNLEQENLTLNPLTTYASTFYLGVWRSSTHSRLRWVYCNDLSSPDNKDEGDCYKFSITMNYQAIDLFLNISISPLSITPFPSTINMKINDTLISNQIIPDRGWWESGELNPAINTTISPQNLVITYCWPDFYQWSVSFNLILEKYFYIRDLFQTEFQADSEETTVTWKILFPIEYPSSSENRRLNISLEKDWSVVTVRRNTIIHTNWSEYDNYLLIDDTYDGMWEIECIAQCYIFDVDFVNSQNELISETNNADLIRIYGCIKDLEDNLVLNGNCNLTVSDPKERQIVQIINQPIEVGSEYNFVFQWDLSTLETESGVYAINLIWTNGTAVGVANSSLRISILVPFLTKAAPYFISFSLLALISGIAYIIFRLILVPKRRERNEHLLKLKNSFTDAFKLRRLLIIHKQSGLCILDPISDESFDANLMGGLLHAISTFGGSIIGTTESSSDFSVNPELKDITYGDNHIRIFDGDYVRTAAIFNGIPSIQMNLKLEEFTDFFEVSHSNELRNWTGKLELTTRFEDIVEDTFSVSLNAEYRLNRIEIETTEIISIKERLQGFSSRIRKTDDKILLTGKEKKLLDFIIKFQGEREDILLGVIIYEYMKNRKKEDLYVFEALFNLLEKEVLVPNT